MKKQNNIILAAIAITMQLPLSASEIANISRKYDVDYQEVINVVHEMCAAEYAALEDMQSTNNN